MKHKLNLISENSKGFISTVSKNDLMKTPFETLVMKKIKGALDHNTSKVYPSYTLTQAVEIHEKQVSLFEV